jgi:prepilin-type N-terminal cleavage/methylation domain-containing protein
MRRTLLRRGGFTNGGFTLLELLVVVAIITTLAAFLIAGLWPQKEKALRSNTAAMIEAVKTALDQYYSEFHDYPPDGYDQEPGWKAPVNNYASPPVAGVGIRLGNPSKNLYYAGSGCLIYFLCYPITNITLIGADMGGTTPDPRNVRKTPCNKGGAFLTTLRRENFSVTFWDPDFEISINPGLSSYKNGWEKGEIVDAFGWPIHYDKVGDGKATDILFANDRFRAAKGIQAHSDQKYYNEFCAAKIADDSQKNFCPNDAHQQGTSLVHADPRCAPESDGCYIDTPTNGLPKVRNPGNADIWSHGKSWANGITAITNWK